MRISHAQKVGILSFVATVAVGFALSRAFVEPAPPVRSLPTQDSREPDVNAEASAMGLPTTLTTDPFFHENLGRFSSQGQAPGAPASGSGRSDRVAGEGPALNASWGAFPPVAGSGSLAGFEPLRPTVGVSADSGLPENVARHDRQLEGRHAERGSDRDPKVVCTLRAVVDAGEPTAFLLVNGTERRVRVGHVLAEGIEVDKIEVWGIEVRRQGKRLRIYVGSEVEL